MENDELISKNERVSRMEGERERMRVDVCVRTSVRVRVFVREIEIVSVSNCVHK